MSEPRDIERVADVEVVRSFYDAMAARAFDRLFALVDPDCVITQDARLPWGGRYEGHDGLATFALLLVGTVESALTIDAIFESDGEVIEVGRTRGKVLASGVTYDIPQVHRWMVRGGKVVTAHFATDTDTMLSVLAEPGGSASG